MNWYVMFRRMRCRKFMADRAEIRKEAAELDHTIESRAIEKIFRAKRFGGCALTWGWLNNLYCF